MQVMPKHGVPFKTICTQIHGIYRARIRQRAAWDKGTYFCHQLTRRKSRRYLVGHLPLILFLSKHQCYLRQRHTEWLWGSQSLSRKPSDFHKAGPRWRLVGCELASLLCNLCRLTGSHTEGPRTWYKDLLFLPRMFNTFWTQCPTFHFCTKPQKLCGQP